MNQPSVAARTFWMVVLVGAAILFSFALACGMPFAALSALAAMAFQFRSAVTLAVIGWLANQAIGFGFLGYPVDATTLGWGLALGLSAGSAVVAAAASFQRVRETNPVACYGVTFLTAWVLQQAIVFAASLVLGGTATAFSIDVVWFIFWTNALAFGLLLVLHMLGVRARLTNSPWPQSVT